MEQRNHPMNNEILTTLTEYIAESILKQPRRQIGAGDPLISSGLVDSFSLVDLSLFIEQRFGVLVHDTELNADTFDTLAQLAELVEQRRRK